MNEFIKYQHIERLGTEEVLNINMGTNYVFPKLDGTNASLWIDNGVLQAGSRNRHLTLETDNAGFYNAMIKDKKIEAFFKKYPDVRLFGEWLVKHSLKTYQDNAWRKFYIFDVATVKEQTEITHDMDDKLNYIAYDKYQVMLKEFELDYIAPLAICINGTYELFTNQIEKNIFLIKDGQGYGEGIVIKNYAYKNKYGRQTWAKLISTEFKNRPLKEMVHAKALVEEEISNTYVTNHLVEKVYSKITLNESWSSKQIPKLLNVVFYDIVKEESWDFVSKFKNPTINFTTLKNFVFRKVKELKPELF